jgi:long-subunit acyl-CoA synthetase (AMP-forming)
VAPRGGVRVNITGDSAQLKRELDQADRHVGKFASESEKHTSRVSRAFSTIAPAAAAAGAGLAMFGVYAVKQASDAAGKSALEASLTQHLKAVNELLDPHEQLDCLVVMTEAWTVDNDLITPTFKVKRNRVEDLFAKNYELWTGLRKRVVWHQA